jgi:hypothetical protein
LKCSISSGLNGCPRKGFSCGWATIRAPDRKECLTPDSPIQGRCFLDAAPELIAGIEAKNRFFFDATQREAIPNDAGPLLIADGPGTGKTEVLVACCLKSCAATRWLRLPTTRKVARPVNTSALIRDLGVLDPYSYQPGDLIASLKKLVL